VTTAPTRDPRTARLVAAYEQLSPASVPALLALYGEQAQFKDPFNEVTGRDAIGRIFHHMFEALRDPRFVVTHSITEGDHAFLAWTFHFRRQGASAEMVVRGATHLHFATDGLVDVHRDYWDAAEELYARLPVLGFLMRWLQRRLATPPAR
jgi:steroid delta-isomerase